MPHISDIAAELATTRRARVELYQEFHRSPELSMGEQATADRIERELVSYGLSVTRVGRTGLVSVIENGDGPVVAMRADIDGLPVTEDSGKAYASTATAVMPDGERVGLMHACGHDIHIVSLLGAIQALLARRDLWSGTFVAVFQPGEETAEGARAMVEAGIVDAMPTPDVFLGQHVMPTIPLGTVAARAGSFMSSAASIRVTVYGRGTHGSMPNTGVDPIVLASSIVLRLQGIVAREIAPSDVAVITVGAIRAGSKSNVIPSSATLLLNTRAFDPAVEKHLHAAIERIVRAECQASLSPREPEFEYYDIFPLTVNDEEATQRVQESFEAHFRSRHVPVGSMAGSEDFSILPGAFGVPSCYWVIGGFEDPATAPGNHSADFAPDLGALDVGAEAILAAAAPWLMR